MALINEFKSQGDYLFRYRSYFPLAIIIVAVLADGYIFFNHLSNPYSITEKYNQYLALAFCILGLSIRVLTVGYTPEGTSGRNTRKGQVATQLNTKGSYSILRHPLYLGNFFMWFGVAIWVKNFWFIMAFIFLFSLYYERIMYAEESFLIGKFKKDFTEWSSKVPAILPNFKEFKKPENSFSLLKVLKKEKNGLFAIFLLFWIFDEVQIISYEHKLVFVRDLWFWLCITTGLIYLILKVLKKNKTLDKHQKHTII